MSVSGRSGINLDRAHAHADSESAFAWVMDGVSPLMRLESHKWHFRRFYRFATAYAPLVDQAHRASRSQQELIQALNLSHRRMTVERFPDTSYNLRPLQSIASVRCKFTEVDFPYAEGFIFGDCAVIVQLDAEEPLLFFSSSLEGAKSWVDNLLNWADRNLSGGQKMALRYLLLTYYRVMQYEFGMYRVLGSRWNFQPSISFCVPIRTGATRIAALSDGLTWPLFGVPKLTAAGYLERLRQGGPSELIRLVRSLEHTHTGVGFMDDATVAYLEV